MPDLPHGLDPDVDWITTTDVAAILGVSRQRVGQLVRKGSLPVVVQRGRYYFRRQQVEAVAEARRARELGRPDS